MPDIRALLKSVIPASLLQGTRREQLRRLLLPRSAYLAMLGTKPLARTWWTDRGREIDRYFIERFIQDNRRFVRGVCLEVQNADYTRRFGEQIDRADVLDVTADNPNANVVGDLRRLDAVPNATYDCIILTQVLQYIDDLHAGVSELARILKPGGTVMVTAPMTQKLDRPHNRDYWRLTTHSMKYLFHKHFPEDHVEVQHWGNVLTGLGAWVGLSQEDLSAAQLDHHDPFYPCIVSARATKPA
jgi:SAM-dependent methyltransferase